MVVSVNILHLMIFSMKTLIPLSVAMTTVLLAGTLAQAVEWPQWGGNDPGRNMYSPAKGFPEKFEPGKFKQNSEEIDLKPDTNWVRGPSFHFSF